MLSDAATGARLQALAGPTDGYKGAEDVAFDPQGRFLATAGPDNRVRLWDVKTWKELVLGEPAAPAKEATAAAAPDYQHLATGRWARVFTEAGDLTDATRATLAAGVLELNDGRADIRSVRAKDMILRARVKRPAFKPFTNVMLWLRRPGVGTDGYGAYFNGGTWFGVGKRVGDRWTDLKAAHSLKPCDDFFEFAFAAVGDKLTVYVNGKLLIETRDTSFPGAGLPSLSSFQCLGQFKDVEVQVLDPPAAPPKEEVAPAPREPVSLFNGKDLTGWVVDSGPKEAWQVVDGAVVGRGTGSRARGWLLSEQTYRDFLLQCQFQLGDGADSGVGFRAERGETLDSLPMHLAVKLRSLPHQQVQTGSLYYWLNTAEPPARPADLKPAGSWNDLEIELRGQKLRVVVNGQEVQKLDLDQFARTEKVLPGVKRTSGRVGLQQHTGEVRFRDVRIKDLTAAKRAVNLLPLIDPAKDDVHGAWKREGNDLVSDGGVAFARLRLPYQPPAEYDFRIEFTRRGADVLQLLSGKGRSFTWLMGAWGGRWDCFDAVKGHPCTREGQGILGAASAVNGPGRRVSVIQVRKDSIAAYIDGKLVVRHATNFSDLSSPGGWDIGNNALGLGTTFSGTVFHAVEVIEVSGEGKLLRAGGK